MVRSSSGRLLIDSVRKRFSDDSGYIDHIWECRGILEEHRNYARHFDWCMRRVGSIHEGSLIGLVLIPLVVGSFSYTIWAFLHAVMTTVAILAKS